MRLASLAVSALLVAQNVQNTPLQQREKQVGRIEGMVIQAESGEPIAKAQVTLNRVTTPPASGTVVSVALGAAAATQILPIETDASGKFLFADLEPGSYRIVSGRNGFIRMNYGERYSGGPGTVVNVMAGQATKDIMFKLVRTAALSGRVRTSSGEPGAGLTVQLVRASYNVTGQRTFQTVASGRTDDHGDYRLFWVSPGRYYLAVLGVRASETLSLLLDGMIISTSSSSNQVVSAALPTVYYPGTADLSRASAIEVGAGWDLPGIDVVIVEQPLYRIRGRIVDSATGQPARAASVSLITRDLGSSISSGSGTTSYNSATGTFEIRDVLAGSYWLRAQASQSVTAQTITPNMVGRPVTEAITGVTQSRSAGQLSLDLTSDRDDIVLTMGPGISIPGILRIDGAPLPENAAPVRVSLRAVDSSALSSPLQQVNPDGTFTLQSIFPGEYRANITALPQDYYVKQAQIDRTDVLNQSMAIGDGVRGTLEVVLAPGAGQIEGVVVDAKSQPVQSVQVLLMPENFRERSELVRSMTTDANGKVLLRGVPPGSYKLFAWESIEPNAYFDPEVLRKYETQGKPIKIVQGDKLTIELRMIPGR